MNAKPSRPNHNCTIWLRGKPIKCRVPLRKVNPRNNRRFMPKSVALSVLDRSGGICEARSMGWLR